MDLETKPILVEQLLSGFLAISKLDFSFISNHADRWGFVFRLIGISSLQQSNSPTGFELATYLMDKPEASINHENFGDCVDLLISFSAVRGDPFDKT